MIKTRLLLALLMLVSAGLFYLGFLFLNAAWLMDKPVLGILAQIGMIVSSLGTFPTSLFMLGFSFFRVYETGDGRLAYDPNNFYWKTMGRLFKEDWKEEISLCKAFWLTTLLMALVVANIGMSFILILVGASLYTGGFALQINSTGWNSEATAISVALLGSVSGIIILAHALNSRRIKSKFLQYLGLSILTFSLVILPIYTFGIVSYLKGAGISLGIGLGISLLILLIFKIVSGDNVFTRFFKAVKENYCPILVARGR